MLEKLKNDIRYDNKVNFINWKFKIMYMIDILDDFYKVFLELLVESCYKYVVIVFYNLEVI